MSATKVMATNDAPVAKYAEVFVINYHQESILTDNYIYNLFLFF